MRRTFVGVLLAVSAWSLPTSTDAAPAFFTGLPGVACAPETPQATGVSFDHRAGTLRNLGETDLTAFCPLPPSVPKKDTFEIRVSIDVSATADPKKVPLCTLMTAVPGGAPATAPPSDGTSDGTVALVFWIIVDPVEALSVHTTVACMLPPGAEIFALERLSE